MLNAFNKGDIAEFEKVSADSAAAINQQPALVGNAQVSHTCPTTAQQQMLHCSHMLHYYSLIIIHYHLHMLCDILPLMHV